MKTLFFDDYNSTGYSHHYCRYFKIGEKIITAAMFALLTLPSVASATDIKPYVGIGIGGYSKDVGGATGTTTVFGGFGQFGADIGDYFGAELRLGTSSTTSITSGGVNIDLNLDYAFSYLGKLQAPITESIRIYTLLGGTTGQVTGKINTPGFGFAASGTNTLSVKTTSFSIGGGLDFQIQDSLSIGAEYMRYYSDVSGFSANLKFLF